MPEEAVVVVMSHELAEPVAQAVVGLDQQDHLTQTMVK
jgi:hypothetical protein